MVRDRLSLFVETWQGDGETCLLIAGAGAIGAFWPDHFCEALNRRGLQVVRYDHRDAGRSSFVEFDKRPYTLSDLVQDALAVLDAVGARRAHWVGHSMGGFIVQLAAIQHPERVLSVTSISSHTASPDLPPPPAQTWEVMLANQPIGELDSDLPGFQKVWRHLNGRAPFDEAAAAAYTRELYARNPKTLPATNHVAAQADMEDRGPALRSVGVPALVIHGEEDPLVPWVGGEITAQAIPNARLVTLRGAGHMFFDSPTWARIAEEILRQIEAP